MDLYAEAFCQVSDRLLSLPKCAQTHSRTHIYTNTQMSLKKNQHSHALLCSQVNDISGCRESQTGRRCVPSALDKCLVSKCSVQAGCVHTCVFMCVCVCRQCFVPADALVTHRGHYNDRITQVHLTIILVDFLLVSVNTLSGPD